jgi:hypothetical protein
MSSAPVVTRSVLLPLIVFTSLHAVYVQAHEIAQIPHNLINQGLAALNLKIEPEIQTLIQARHLVSLEPAVSLQKQQIPS